VFSFRSAGFLFEHTLKPDSPLATRPGVLDVFLLITVLRLRSSKVFLALSP
jgi:hypothetical protein